MSLKQLSNEDRIFFLRDFVLELIASSARDEQLKELIKIEKIKRKHLGENEDKEIPFNVIFESKPEFGKLSIPKYHQQLQKSISQPQPISQPHYQKSQQQFRPSLVHQPTTLPKPTQPQPMLTGQPIQPIQQLSQPFSQGEELVKIEPLIRDNAVQMIECPGAGKNIIVKVRNKMNITRIVLNETEIRNIIHYFSKTAKIPITGGILKVSLDSILFSAVISEYVGARFIITKKSPYELIEGVS